MRRLLVVLFVGTLPVGFALGLTLAVGLVLATVLPGLLLCRRNG